MGYDPNKKDVKFFPKNKRENMGAAVESLFTSYEKKYKMVLIGLE